MSDRTDRVVNWGAGLLVAGIGLAVYVWPPTPTANAEQPPPPAQVVPAATPPENIPPGWIMTFVPSPRYSSPSAIAASWCEGTTRVHTVTTDDSAGGTAQDLELNARTCGGTA